MTYKLSYTQAKSLVTWYIKNKRLLPWRDTNNPYDVWLSEIMLQQTRVEVVIPYFLRFKETLPTIQDLATCEEETLLKLWESLGYYSRVRNLKKAAQILMEKYDGKLPKEETLLKELPGIGPYTAGAISAIAFGKPIPAVDGNVLRVLTRYFGIKEDIRLNSTRKKLEDILISFYQNNDKKIDEAFVSNLTQGFMELGALNCIPSGKPNCAHCPMRKNCYAYLNNETSTIPYRSALKKRRKEKMSVCVIEDDTLICVNKRKESLLHGLYEFPHFKDHLSKQEIIHNLEEIGYEVLRIHPLGSYTHIFSHIEWDMIGYKIKVTSCKNGPYTTIKKSQIHDLAFPSAFQYYFD